MNTRIKKVICLICALALLFALTACSKTTSGKTIERGSWSGTTYTNNFAGLTFNAPADWSTYTDEEMANLLKVTSDVYEGSDFAKKMVEVANVYDMMVSDQVGGSNVIVMYENLTLTAFGQKLTPEAYLDLLKPQLGSGYEFADGYTEKQIGQNKYMLLSATIPGYAMGQTYAVRMEGNYMIGIILTYVDPQTEASLLSYFS